LRKSKIKVLVISVFADEGSIVKAVELGAHGIVSKEADSAELHKAIQEVVSNGSYYNDKVIAAMAHRLMTGKKIKPGFRSGKISFSEREINIIELLSKECSNLEIARKLHLSPRSIEGIRLELIKRADVKSSIGLVLFAAKKGVIKI
jgi:DNA-binding NarL/FixJ family response regulator